MKRFILITLALAMLFCVACTKDPDVVDVNVNPTATVAPAMTDEPIASAEPQTTLEAGSTQEAVLPGITAEPVLTGTPAASATATANTTSTPSTENKGLLGVIPTFTTGGKIVDKVNDEDLGLIQAENVTEEEFKGYISALESNGFEGKIESENSEMRYGTFTNDSYVVNVTYTVMSGYPREFLLCVAPQD